MTSFFHHRDRVFALVLIVLASIFYALIGGMDEPYSPGALAASSYPRFILLCIIVLSCVLVVRPVSPLSNADDSQETSHYSVQGLAAILLTAGYIFLVESLGFFILTPVFLFLIPLVVGYRNHAINAASAVLVTAGLYAVFVLTLNIPLPAGLLGD